MNSTVGPSQARRLSFYYCLSVANRVFSRPVAWPVVTMETVGQTNQRTVTAGAQALSAHYIMLIRPLQALPLVRIYRKLFILKYIF